MKGYTTHVWSQPKWDKGLALRISQNQGAIILIYLLFYEAITLCKEH